MLPTVLQQLQSRSAGLHVRWEMLLRIEPVRTPLANPDALVRLIPDSIAEILTLLQSNSGENVSLIETQTDRLPACHCGRNPYLAYFIAAEQAFVETIVLIQSELPAEHRRERDVAVAIRTIRELGRSEIDTFCSICAFRGSDPRCRHAAAGCMPVR